MVNVVFYDPVNNNDLPAQATACWIQSETDSNTFYQILTVDETVYPNLVRFEYNSITKIYII